MMPGMHVAAGHASLRHRWLPALVLLAMLLGASPGAATAEFPAGDEGYHTYDEMHAAIVRAEAAHPDIVRVFSVGRSWEGRELWAAEVSDRVGTNEGEPEVLLDGLHHGNEHMSAEMTLAVFRWLTDGYGVDPRITRIVDTRRIWIVFMVNPDGGEYDIADGRYVGWRRNRQPTPGTDLIGTDVNRNYGFKWGCCGGASSDPASGRFAGPSPFSAPEARAMADFMLSRVADGRQRIGVHISFHTSGRLVMYPYGFTRVDVPPQMTALDQRTFVAIAAAMAGTNGYRPQQASDLYISSGTFGSFSYARHRTFAFVFELTSAANPPDERIPRETRRNREAVLSLLELADCPYRAIGKEAAWCGPFADDLEIPRGWTVDPDGTDTATDGRWVRGVPRPDPYQRPDATSGQSVLVTGRPAGADVDGGRTTVRSATFGLPDGKASALRLRAWVGLDAAAGADDGLVIRIVDAGGAPIGDPLLVVTGDGTERPPAWRWLTVDLPPGTAGRRVAIELVATDATADGDATVEAAVDDVRVVTR